MKLCYNDFMNGKIIEYCKERSDYFLKNTWDLYPLYKNDENKITNISDICADVFFIESFLCKKDDHEVFRSILNAADMITMVMEYGLKLKGTGH